MANSRPAPAAGPVNDPGGPSFPVNTSRAQSIPRDGAPSSPATASQPVSRTGTGLPLNTPRTQPAGNMPGLPSWSVAGPVNDPGGTRLSLAGTSTIGYPADRATPAGGDPSALGTNFVTADSDAPTWTQHNPNANPNPGALRGGVETAPAGLYPGETPLSQVSPNANPNPGGL